MEFIGKTDKVLPESHTQSTYISIPYVYNCIQDRKS